MARHWSERMTCICGWSTFSVTKEAYHRHNFPALCRRSRKNEGSKGPSVTTHSRTEGDLTMTQKDRDDARDLELEALLDRAHAAAAKAADMLTAVESMSPAELAQLSQQVYGSRANSEQSVEEETGECESQEVR